MNKQSMFFVAAIVVAFYFLNFFLAPEQKQSGSRPETVQAQPITHPAKSTPSGQEQFYVLENSYQQLVFSNIGGSIVEINLPLHSKTHEHSPIRAVRVDREIKEDAPQNDLFPAQSFLIADPNPMKKEKGISGGYYPLLRRGIKETSQRPGSPVPPRYYAFNTLSDSPETAHIVYSVKKFSSTLIEFVGSDGERTITKTYRLPSQPSNSPYSFEMDLTVAGNQKGLWLTSGIPEVELISGNWTPMIQYRVSEGKSRKIEKISLPKTATAVSTSPDWVCNSNGFFGLIIDPLGQVVTNVTAAAISGDNDPTRLTLVDAAHDLYPAEKYPGYEIRLALSDSSATTHFRVFAGPLVKDILKAMDKTYADPAKGYEPDYTATQSSHGWFSFISEPFAKFLFFLMDFFHMITHSWGISIILLTVALRLMLYPLTAWSIKSSQKMQKVAPQVHAIQERNKKDPKKAQMEIMALYREKGVNPLSGCLPLLIQMPFLIGMFDLLKSTFQLRGASFIPGWITDLSAPDVLFSWGMPIFFFGTSFHLLPIILGAVMYFQQKMSSPLPKDPKMLTDQQKQQKMMGNIMTVVFTVMFYHFPSGLNIYWLSSLLLAMLQQWWMTKRKAA